MVSKANLARRNDMPCNVQALSGKELHHLKLNKESEYLLIDLGDISGRHAAFGEMMEIAIEAAVNAALSSLISLNDEVSRSLHLAAAEKKQQRAERNARRLDKLNEQILQDSVWLSARELSDKANFKNDNPSAGPNRWKASGAIFAVPVNGKDNYPRYLLDEGYRPLPAVKKILSIFGDSKTPWGLAIWFGSGNSWLDGQKPKDVLATMSERVIAAAKEECEGGLHG